MGIVRTMGDEDIRRNSIYRILYRLDRVDPICDARVAQIPKGELICTDRRSRTPALFLSGFWISRGFTSCQHKNVDSMPILLEEGKGSAAPKFNVIWVCAYCKDSQYGSPGLGHQTPMPLGETFFHSIVESFSSELAISLLVWSGLWDVEAPRWER